MRASGVAASMVAWIMFCCLPLDGQATTLRVEKDGSGDYTIIQDALDAAAPGDTVRVGVGRFDTFRLRTATTNGFQFQSIAHLTTGDLTLIGAGDSLTVIGPTVYQEMIDGKVTVGITTDSGVSPSRVSGFLLQNLQTPMIIRSSNVAITLCIVDSRASGLNSIGIRVNRGVDNRVTRCVFVGDNGVGTAAGGVQRLTVEGCQFTDDTLRGQAVIIGNGATDCMVRRCTFLRGGGGVQFSISSTGWVEDCDFRELDVVGVSISTSAAIVRRCNIAPGTKFPVSVGSGRLEIYDSVIGGGRAATILSWAQMIVRGSHILEGDCLTVDARISAPGEFLDFAGNWWGTTDTTQIRAKIFDPNDRVIIDPIAQHPLPVQEATVGGLKGMYCPPK